MVKVDIGQEILDADHQTVGRCHERLVSDCNEIGTDSSSAEDIESSQGLDVLEAFGKENIDTFHIANIRKKLVIFAY